MSDYDAWDVKARRGFGAKFDDDLHPRDRKGRFIETNALVSVWGGGRGTVVKNVGGGRLEVRMQDGSVQRIHRNYLTVQKRPDGSKPTSKASANPASMKVEQASADAADFTPDTPDGRTPVRNLKSGQAVIVYGRASDPTGETDPGDDVRQHVGTVRWVRPGQNGGWTVRLAEADETAKPVDVGISDRNAVARVLPADKMAELTQAIHDGKPEAADLARSLLADALDQDDREADWQGLSPDAGWDEWAAELNEQFGINAASEDLQRAYDSTTGDQRVRQAATANTDVGNFGLLFGEVLQDRIADEIDLTGGLGQAYFANDTRFRDAFTRAARDRAHREIREGQPGGQAEQPKPARTPATPRTVVPGDLETGDRVTFDIPVTAANVERFAGPGAKNPPRPGASVTVRGVVEGVETDMFGGSTVHLRRDGAQWQGAGGGGRLDGDGLDWPLDEDHAVHKTGKADAPQQRRGGSAAPVRTAPQGGLFADVGREAQGTEDMFTAHERDRDREDEPSPAARPAQAEPERRERAQAEPERRDRDRAAQEDAGRERERADEPEEQAETTPDTAVADAGGEERAKELSRQAKQAFEAGDYGRALRLHSEAVEAWPDMNDATRARMDRNRQVIQSHWRRKGSDEDLAGWARTELRGQPDTDEVTPLLKDLDRGDRVFLPNPGGRGGREVIILGVPEKVGTGPRARGRISYIMRDGRRGTEARSWNARLTVLRGWEPLPKDDGTAEAGPDDTRRLERNLSVRPGLLPRDVEQRLATARGRLIETLGGNDYRAVEQAASDYQRELNAAYQGLPRHMPRRDIAQNEITKTNRAVGVARHEWAMSHNDLPDPRTLDMTTLSEAELDELAWRARNSPMGAGFGQQILTMVTDEESRRRAEGERRQDEPAQVDTNRDDRVTVSSTMGAPKTGPAPDEGDDDGLRGDRAQALGDVPADSAERVGGPGRALRGSGASGGGQDRRTGRGDGRAGAGRGDVRGEAGQAGDRAARGAGDSDEGRDLPARRTGSGGRRASAPVADADAGGFRPASQDDLAPSGEKAKARANIAAVRLLRQLQAEDRPATEDEKRILARWSGWGSLPVVLDTRPSERAKEFRNPDGSVNREKYERAVKRWESFAPERDELRAMLSDEEWREASRNTLNAHYTDASLVGEVWDAVQQLGFNGGNVLEPGSGVGTFIGMAPERAHMTGIELDSTTAAISQHLYPNATVRNESFADTRAPDNTFDLAIGNVPFGDYWLVDKKHNPGEKHSIHNHFILKSLALTRPGGLVAVVTSRYTMDSENSAARREMAAMGDLVGAVRLPSGAHRKAAGTDVVTDLLIFRKRDEGEEPADTSWIDAPKMDVNGHPHPVNTYFQQHPENILGEQTTGRGQFSDHDLIVKGERDAAPALREALARVVADAQQDGKTFEQRAQAAAPIRLAARDERHDGALTLTPDGTFTQVRDGQAQPAAVHPSQVEQLTGLVGLRDVARELLAEESRSDTDSPRLAELRAELNRRYDAYTAKYGSPSKKANRRFTSEEARAKAVAEGRKPGAKDMTPTAVGWLKSDPASAIVFKGLDHYDADSDTARKADMLERRVIGAKKPLTSTDDPGEALAVVLDQFGELRLDEIARLLRVDEETARERLGDRVYDAPSFVVKDGLVLDTGEPDKLVPAAEYLSGNVRHKLIAAQRAAENHPRFMLNVAALERVLPRDLTPGEIDAKMGAAWISADVVQEFLREILGDSSVRVNHASGSLWEVLGDKQGYEARHVYGTNRDNWTALGIAEALLKQTTIKVRKSIGDGVTVPDPAGTIEVQQKAQEMAERFSEWVWENPERADRLARVYNDQFNSIVLRSYDGAEPALPGIAADWQGKVATHQKAAVARIINEPATLLAHEVGAGKTAEMVMGAMELRRTGMASKPTIVVPNHMLEQFTREFLELYPNANILAAGSADLTGEKRREFVARAATNDLDCVILTQKAFEKIDMHPDKQRDYRDSELNKLRASIAKAREFGEDSRLLKRLERQLVQAEEKLKAKLDSKKDEGNVYFEHTGIDYVFVDEAHMYKNLRTASRIEGASIDGSGRASDLHMKLHHLRENSRSGRVVTFATGTDIANSVTEAYVMMRYLRPDLLREAGIDDFDTWAATFGDVIVDVELNPDGNGFRSKARFAKFRNVPELLRIYRVFADVKTAEDLGLPTPKVRRDANGNRGETVVVPASMEQLDYIKELGERAEKVRRGAVEPDEDNMLKISGDGKRAALDMRLIDPTTDQAGGKIEVAADKIAEIFEHSKDWQYPVAKGSDEMHPTTGALQIVFMDQGTPKPKKKPKSLLPKSTSVRANTAKVGDWLMDDRKVPHQITRIEAGEDDQLLIHLESPGGTPDMIEVGPSSFLNQVPDPDTWAKKDGDQEALDAPVGDGDTSTWAAYDEMKAQLVARGIPAEKIRYIHEANTDAQKAKLFEEARTGKIAVLLGSTEKMGTGTNVQARAVALHHMDCPWRPADLAQREGRVERQGNLNKDLHDQDVRIIRYVTEGTFDGYSWQTVERKQKFIAQMKRGTLDIREIEDIGDSALSFAEVKALATGNPYLLDHAKANTERERLDRLERAHQRTQGTLVQQIKQAEGTIKDLTSDIAEWREAIAQRTETRGDDFTMRLGDLETSKRADVYEPLLAAVREVRDGVTAEGHKVQIGELGGHPVYAWKDRRYVGDRLFRVVEVGFDFAGGASSYRPEQLTDGSGNGILRALENRLSGLEPSIEAAGKRIATLQEQIGKRRADIGKPFSKADQLSYYRERVRLLNEVLQLQSNLDEIKDPESDAYKEAQTELTVLKGRLDLLQPPNPAAADEPTPTPEDVKFEDPTPTVHTDDDGFAVPAVPDADAAPGGDVDQADAPEPDGTSRAGSSNDPGESGSVPADAPEGGQGLPEGLSEADGRALESLIREEAAAYAWTGSPSRYIAELFAKQTGRARFDGDSDPAVERWVDDYLAANPDVRELSAGAREQLRRERTEREARDRDRAIALSQEAQARSAEGDHEGALSLIDEAEQADPRARNWERIRGIIRDRQQGADGAVSEPAPREETAGQLPPVPVDEPDSALADVDEPAPLDEPAADVVRETEAVDPEALMPGDRIRIVRTSDGVRRVRTRGGGTRLAQSDGRVWEGTVPDNYRPGSAVRLRDVVETEGGQPPRYVADPGLVRLTDAVDRLGTDEAATSAVEAARLRDSREQAREQNRREQAERRRQMLEEEGGTSLADAVDAFEAAAAPGSGASRREIEDAWLRADAALASAEETATHWARQAQLKTLRSTLNDRLRMAGGREGDARRRAAEWEQAKADADRVADDGVPEPAPAEDLQPGDRVDTPAGDETVVVEEVTRAGDITFTTERDSQDRRTIRARKEGTEVTKRSGGRKPPEIGEAAAADVVVGEWLIDDDGTASKVTTIDRDGDRITFEVLGPNGPSLVDADAGETVTRGRGLRMKRPRKPRPPRERKPRSTITALDDGTPATRVRLRSDIRKRVLGLAIEDDENAPEIARTAATRLRASQPVSAEQMRALGQYLRTLAAQDRPAVQRRSLERAASWVDASYARLAGYPAPPHESHRDAPEKAYPENLTVGDIIAIPDSAGGDIQPVRVVDVKPTPRMPFVTATVEHGDGRREQRILAAGVDVYLMPDLPGDVDVPPTPDDEFDPEEHIHPDRLEVGDAIRHKVGNSPIGRVMAIRKTSRPFADTEEWQVDLATLDDNDRPIQQERVTLSSRGGPSVVRTWRGELSRPQPWDAAIDNSSGDGIVTADQLAIGDRVAIRTVMGEEVAGTIIDFLAIVDDDGLQTARRAVLRGYDGEIDWSPLIDGDGSEIVRLAKGGAGAEDRIRAEMDAQGKRNRERTITRVLADAETGLYREVSARLLGDLDTRPLVPARERGDDEVYAQALTRLEQVWQSQPEGLAEQVADALAPPTDEQFDELTRRLEPVMAEVRDRAAVNMVTAIGEIDPMPGESWDQALRRVMIQYRDMPPSDSLARAGEALAKADLRSATDAPAPELPTVKEADLPARMAAYRAALPEDLTNLGRKQVQRPVFRSTSLADLEAGQTPAADTVTTWADDVAADGGPGEHAMRHLAVLRAAGADLDEIYRQRYAAADPEGIVRDFTGVEHRAKELLGEAFAADRNLLAAKKRTRTKTAKKFGYSSMRALNADASWEVKRQAKEAWEAAYADDLKERDAALNAYRAAADDVLGNLRARREARRAAAMEALATVRDLGGEGLEYRGRYTVGELSENDRLVKAMRIAEASYPSDWLARAREAGPIRVDSGRGYYLEGDDRSRPEIALPWEATPNDVPRDGRWETEEPSASQMVGNNSATRASVHELGHHMEKIVPGLLEAERAFLWARTSTGPVGERERTPTIQTNNGADTLYAHDGGFDLPYSGREYSTGFFELFTVGMESLMGGSAHLDQDDDYRAFTFGALALLGTGQDGPRRSPLAGVNLSELSEAELRALLSQVWGNPDEVAQVMAALDRVEAKNDPLAGVQLDRMDLGDLVSLLAQVDDDYSVARISAAMEAWEAERRVQDEEDRAFAERSARVDQLMAEGMPELEAWAQVHGLSYEQVERDVRAGDRMAGETRDQMARRHYDLWLHSQYLQAVADTKGYLLNPQGVAAGVDEKSLFSGRRDRARKYASEELRRWFDANGWMNFTEFKAQMLDRERDQRAAKAGRGARDFNR
ncbi:SNF2-related protein [Nonomuraea purpurea]|uniref:SNF2-related protein n=1 Tax=Nonomuraea purpurea TaxID=1849276 RepID=A0ABV8GQL2_9ACTN